MERKRVCPLGQFNQDGILGAFGSVIFGDLRAEPSRLHANQRIQLRIKLGRSAENLSRNLIFLERDSRFADRVVCKIAKKLAERLGAVKSMAVNQPVNFDQARLNASYMLCYGHGNRE
jgi:hypothetical protein